MLVRTSKNAACFSTLNISFWCEFSVDVISSCMPMTVRYKITYLRKYRVHVVYGMVTLVRFLVFCCEGVCGIKETSISVWGTLIYRLFTVFSVAASFSEATPVRLPDWPRWRWPSRCQHVSGMTNYPIRRHRIQLDHVGPHLTSCERSYSTEDVICLCEITHHQNLLKLHIALMALFQWSRPDNQLRPTNTMQEFPFHLSTRLHPVFIICTALFLSEVTDHCLLHGFLDTHLLIHSWCDIARNRVGTIIGRWRCFLAIPVMGVCKLSARLRLNDNLSANMNGLCTGICGVLLLLYILTLRDC